MSTKLVAVVAVASAIGGILFTPPPPAWADCLWRVPGQLELYQDDGWNITIPLNGSRASGWRVDGARYSNPDNPDWSYGRAEGRIDFTHLVIDIEWNNDSTGHYDGYVYQDGVATGQSSYSNKAGRQTFHSGWSSNKLICQKA